MAKRALRLGGAASLVLVSAFAAARPFNESDIFWQLSLGRAVLHHHARTVPEPHALASFARQCTAQEWLWDVVVYGLHRAFGWAGLVLFIALSAGAAAWAVLAMLRRGPSLVREVDLGWRSVAAIALAAALVMQGVLSRMHERPESMGLILLPLFVLLVRSPLASDSPRARVKRASLLFGLEVLWAQIHPTFFLALPIYAIVASDDALRRRDRGSRIAHVATGALLGLGLLTSAYGLGIFRALLHHAHGFAVSQIQDMAAPPLAQFDPTQWGPHVAWMLLVILGVAGALIARRVPRVEVGLAVLGAALVFKASRGVGPGAVLVGPLASEGVLALLTFWPAWVSPAVVALAALPPIGSALRTQNGDYVTHYLGLREGWFPRRAAEYLAGAPNGTPVLTTFFTGPSIGFWTDGRVRTYMDSRIPLYFDDADFAAAQQVFRVRTALHLAVERYGFEAAVVERREPICEGLRADPAWFPVLVEANTTLFVRTGSRLSGRPLERLAPCGLGYIAPHACGEDHGAALASEIRTVDPSGSSAFVRYLSTERLVRCQPDGTTAEAALALLPLREDSPVFEMQRDTLEVRLQLLTGQSDQAFALAAKMLDEGDIAAPLLVMPALVQQGRWSTLRALLEPTSIAHGSDVVPDVEAVLALACAKEEDAACARLHGLRAAALGSKAAGPALCWLEAQQRSPHERDDVRAWLAVLAKNNPGDPSFVCGPSAADIASP